MKTKTRGNDESEDKKKQNAFNLTDNRKIDSTQNRFIVPWQMSEQTEYRLVK